MSSALDWVHRVSFALAALATTSPAMARTAQTPTISGDAWVAYAIIAALVAMIALLAAGAFALEQRDAKAGRRDNDDDATPLIF